MTLQKSAPRARKQFEELTAHGHVRIDPYYWMNRRDDPQVIDYLEQENAFTDEAMAGTAGLRQELVEEFKNRVKQDDSTAPYRKDDYYYYTRYEEGVAYPFVCRKHLSLDAPEQVMLDINTLADGHDYYNVGHITVSNGQNLLAYSEDTLGRRIYTIRVKNLDTGENLADQVEGTTGSMVWANDNKTLFYTKQDPQTLRSYQVWRHRLGDDPSDDRLVYEEADETFNAFVGRTKSRQYIVLGVSQTEATEFYTIPADDPEQPPTLFLERRRGHRYSVDHHDGRFFIRTNDGAPNYKVMQTAQSQPEQAHWQPLVDHRDDVYIADFELFDGHFVVEERVEASTRLVVHTWDGASHEIAFDESAYSAGLGINAHADTPIVRYSYSSMTTPASVYEYDMNTRERTLLKQVEVLGGFDSKNYRTDRLWATARDGTRVPISIVHHKDFKPDGTRPLLLYGYGSYGITLDASFEPLRISLLDRGFAYAIAHVRGGQELGRAWYESGRLEHKINTFTDFVDCAEFLIGKGYADPDRIYAAGGSAGGLLVGAVLNMRPDLFHGAIASVPFVDVVTTMLDDSIPLTTGEYDEWGNPNVKEDYEHILSYSPYDNVEAKDYPHLLIVSGLHDSQVQYWEPTKWCAKLRDVKTDDNLLLLKTEMDAGHSGGSGRFRHYEEVAFKFAFLLHLAAMSQ